MKRKILLLLILFFSIKLWAFPPTGLSFDLGFCQDFIKKESTQLHADLRIEVSDDFEIRAPLTYTFNSDSKIADAGVSFIYYPFGKGLYFGISAIQFAYFDNSFLAMNEVYAGWTFHLFRSSFFVEGEVCIRDPSATYSDEYSALRGFFPSYSSFRFRLKTGYKFFFKE